MSKRKLRLLSFCLMLCLLIATAAGSPSACATEVTAIPIGKVLTTISSTPVQFMHVSNITPATSTTGCYISSMVWRDSAGNQVTGEFSDGNLHTVEIRVEAVGGYYFDPALSVYLNNEKADFVLDPSGTALTLTRCYVPAAWMPSIIKHPGSETVDVGGWASFAVSALYCKEYKWSLISPDGGTVIACPDAPSRFPGLVVDPDGSSKMNLYNIPGELDGWKIRCAFVGPGGSIDSSPAKITVNGAPEPTPQPTAEPTAEPETPAGDGESSAEAEHEHDFSGSWLNDASRHWKSCECGESGDKAAHSLSWTMTKPATRKEEGLEEGRCTVCGYTESRAIPAGGEASGEESGDSRQEGRNFFKYILLGIVGLLLLLFLILFLDYMQQRRRRRRRRRRNQRRY